MMSLDRYRTLNELIREEALEIEREQALMRAIREAARNSLAEEPNQGEQARPSTPALRHPEEIGRELGSRP